MHVNNQFLIKHEHRILGLMLFTLLAALHLRNSEVVSQSLLLIHFGFFLAWQPVINKQRTFNNIQLAALLVLLFGFIYLNNPWLIAFWSLILLTMLTGRIFARGLSRAAYGLAVIVLFLEIILNITPGLFNLTALSSSFQTFFNPAITLLPLGLLVVPSSDGTSKTIDFIRGFFIILLIIFLCMSSVLMAMSTEQSYIESLASSIFILSSFLLITSFLWTPRAGFTGLARFWEKYILDIGGPFEEWLTHISSLESNSSLHPETFLSASLRYLMQQHWVCGIQWKTAYNQGDEGVSSAWHVSIFDDELKLKVFTTTPVGPSLLLHAKLLLSVLTFYYRAKLQEQQLIKQAHLQAIYETGSKLTHDVKNILQSTHTMTEILQDKDVSAEDILHALQKQMPLLTQRLNTTLDKLNAPKQSTATETTHGSLLKWWNQLQLRYTGRHIEFISAISTDIKIQVDVLTTVTENLLDNARSKRIREPEILISVELDVIGDKLHLTVTDTGSIIEQHVKHRLFRDVVTSQDGFGIGLYQCHELAKAHGYELRIGNNSAGNVSFVLEQL